MTVLGSALALPDGREFTSEVLLKDESLDLAVLKIEADEPFPVIALGDSVYPNTFCFGGKKFDALLSSLGAVRIGERLEHDARGPDYPEDLAAAWTDAWLELVGDVA